ncbi:MFS transporter [Streptomyces zaomyceticus]|uniref:MFS transporter n=1 Tax=Streptomyces zaomyceticus TaxID=68286 RepID=UPI002E1CEF79
MDSAVTTPAPALDKPLMHYGKRTLDRIAPDMAQPDYRLLDICPLTPHIGAEIEGVDLSLPIGEDVAEEIRQALLEWKVLFFRDQHGFDPQSQLAFSALWGEPEANPFFPKGDTAGVSRLAKDAMAMGTENIWHSDHSFMAAPALGSVLGAAEGPAYPVAQQTTLSWFPNHRRNLPGALIVLGITLGVLVAAPVLTWLINHHGWRSAVAAVALVGVVWTLLWIPFGGEGPYATTSDNDSPAEAARDDGPGTGKGAGAGIAGQAQARMPYRRILATRTWIGVTIGYFSTYWVIAFALVWLPSYLREGLGYSAAASTQLLMLFWGLSGILVLGQAGLTGWMLRRGIASRWARGWVGGVLLLISGASCLALPLVPAGAVTVVLLVGSFGLSGAMGGIAATTIMELAPAHRRGGALGMMNAVVTTAGLIAPTLIGSLVDTHGAGGYEDAVLITGALLLVGGTAAVTLINPDRDARLLSV